MHKRNTLSPGFTIVELLIVIVVIAILAAISIVAYTGIQQRAENTKTINAVSQVIRSVQAYMAANGAFPRDNGSYCLVPNTNGICTIYSPTTMTPDSTILNNIGTISNVPSSIQVGHANFQGIVFNRSDGRTFNGTTQALAIVYSLRGSAQQCGVPNVMNNGGATTLTSSTGYTGTDSTTTYCFVSVSGP